MWRLSEGNPNLLVRTLFMLRKVLSPGQECSFDGRCMSVDAGIVGAMDAQ
jgi:hypothetical protein